MHNHRHYEHMAAKQHHPFLDDSCLDMKWAHECMSVHSVACRLCNAARRSVVFICRIRLGKGRSLSFYLPSRLIQMDFFGSIGSTPAHFPLTTSRLLPKYDSTTHTPSSQAPYIPACTTTTTTSIWLPSCTPSSMIHV